MSVAAVAVFLQNEYKKKEREKMLKNIDTCSVVSHGGRFEHSLKRETYLLRRPRPPLTT